MNQEKRKRTGLPVAPRSLFLIFFFSFLIFHVQRLALPPFWDEIFGLHNQALFLAKNHWNLASLFQKGQTYLQGGSAIYPFGILPYLCGVLYTIFPPVVVRILWRLISIACASLSGVLTFRMAESAGISREVSLLGTAAFLLTPLYSAQTGSAGQEIIMGTLMMGSLWYFWNQRGIPALIFAWVACFVKLTAAVMFPVYAFWFFCVFLRKKQKKHLYFFLASCTGLLLVLLPHLLYAVPLGITGRTQFFEKCVVVFWEQTVLFFPWLFLFLTAGLVIWLFSKDKIREVSAEFWVFPLLVCAFFAAYFLQTNMARCPRYAAIVVLPAGFTLQYFLRNRSRKFQILFFSTVLAVNLLNQNGLLFPAIPVMKQADGSCYERSCESFELLQLHVQAAAGLERDFPVTQIVCGWPFPQELTVPEFGYVKKPLNIFTGKIFPKYANAKHLSELDFGKTVYVLVEMPVTPPGVCFTDPASLQVIREFHYPGDILLLNGPDFPSQLQKYREDPGK